MLLVPSAKSVPPAAAPQSYVPGIDHFKCHRVVGVRFEHIPGITVDDQFVGEIDVDLKRPRRFCVAVSKQVGEGPVEPRLDPAARLLCYKERSRAGRPSLPDGPPWVLNQFVDPAEQFEVFGPRELCVPVQPDPGAPTPTTTPTPTVTATPTRRRRQPPPRRRRAATASSIQASSVRDRAPAAFSAVKSPAAHASGAPASPCVVPSASAASQCVHRVIRVRSVPCSKLVIAAGAQWGRMPVAGLATRTSRCAAAGPVRLSERAIQGRTGRLTAVSADPRACRVKPSVVAYVPRDRFAHSSLTRPRVPVRRHHDE